MKQITKNEIYKHYIALDWSKVNFALASIRDAGTKYKVVEHPADLKLLKQCLKQLPGKKIMTIEETTSPAVVGVPKSLLKRTLFAYNFFFKSFVIVN